MQRHDIRVGRNNCNPVTRLNTSLNKSIRKILYALGPEMDVTIETDGT